MKWCLQRMKPFIIECGIIHNRLQALVYLLSLKWLPPVPPPRHSPLPLPRCSPFPPPRCSPFCCLVDSPAVLSIRPLSYCFSCYPVDPPIVLLVCPPSRQFALGGFVAVAILIIVIVFAAAAARTVVVVFTAAAACTVVIVVAGAGASPIIVVALHQCGV